MPATNHTATLDLSQFVDADKPTWRGDYNSDMAKIEAAFTGLPSTTTLEGEIAAIRAVTDSAFETNLSTLFVKPIAKFSPGSVAAPLAYVNIKDYGAVGDGSADDTIAIENSINAAVPFGAGILITGRCKTTAPIPLPVSGAVNIYAGVADSNPFGGLSVNKASIESTGAAVFSQAASGQVVMTMKDVNFRNLGASSAVLFTGVTLNTSTIVGCSSAKYGHVFDSTCAVTQVTRIVGNRFENNGISWSAGSIVDAFICENYINGDPTTNATMVTGSVATSTFALNYIDFFKRVFDVIQGNIDVRVIGNIFDYVWNTLGTSSAQNIGSFTFNGNTWTHCQSSVALSHYPNADSDMTSTPWRAIDSGTNALTHVAVTGNNVEGVDGFIRCHGGIGAVRESGNSFHGGFTASLIDIQPSFYTTTPPDVIIESLEQYVASTTYAGAQTIDWSTGGIQVLTLTGNLTSLTFNNAIKNRTYRLRIVQDGTGGRTLAGVNAAIKFGGTPALSKVANASDSFTFFYDGTNYYETSRLMNSGGSTFTPMGPLWQLASTGKTDWYNNATDAYPILSINPIYNTGPGTYGGFFAGRGNVSPDASFARGNDNQPSWISNAPYLKKIVASTLASNGGVNLNPYTGDVFVVTLQANATSFALSTTATSTGYSQEFRVEFVQDATGSRTLSSPNANIKWAGGVPTLSTGANKRDIFTFRYDGTNFYEVTRSMNVG